jgi:hypothetical protein
MVQAEDKRLTYCEVPYLDIKLLLRMCPPHSLSIAISLNHDSSKTHICLTGV